VVREAEVLARRLTWLSTLAFDYAKGAADMETGTMERVLSELVRFEIAASDHARAIVPERSRVEAEMAVQRELALQDVLKEALFTRNRETARAPVQEAAKRLGVQLHEDTSDWMQLAYEATRALYDLSVERSRRDQGVFAQPSPYFQAAMAVRPELAPAASPTTAPITSPLVVSPQPASCMSAVVPVRSDPAPEAETKQSVQERSLLEGFQRYAEVRVEGKAGKEVDEPIGTVTGPSSKRLRIAYAPNGVQGYPTVASIKEAQDDVARLLTELGHNVELIEHPVNGLEFFENFSFAFLPKFRPLLATVTAITGRTSAESGLLSRWTATMIETSRNFTDDQIRKGNAYFENTEAIYGGVFDKCDLLFTPVSPDETPLLGSMKPSDSWDEKGHLFKRVMSITAPTNAVGDCAISVPLSVSRETGMPVGFMFQAKAGGDKMLYELAYELEEARQWKDKWAPYSAKFIPI
jgi:Amidase